MKTEREHQLDQALEGILRILTTHYAPEKVILFGSVARGNVSEWSDLDLLVIKDTPQPFLQRLKEVALLCQATVGVDYLVYTPAELERMIADGNPFVLGEILAHGKVLYERQPFTAMA
jgi:predicted nucleotidyltransferase